MKADKALGLWVGTAAAAALALLGLTLGGLWASLEAAERALLAPLLQERGAMLFLAALVAGGGAALVARWAYTRYPQGLARLLEQARVAAAGAAVQPLAAPNTALQPTADALNGLLSQARQLRTDMAERVQEAARGIEQEKSRLAALMSELTQSVVVCNLDGRILLYNGRARSQFRALSRTPGVAAGAELIGLGRSIYTVFERQLVAHALENLRARLERGVPNPSTQFVTTTASGQLLKVQLAAVRDVDSEAALNGFVLMLENITREFEEQSERDQVLLALTEGSRGSLANLQAALEMLELPDLDEAMRGRFLGVIGEESRAMSQRVNELSQRSAAGMKTRWPLQEMLAADLCAAACQRLLAHGLRHCSAEEVQPGVWLRVDSFSLLQALGYLGLRLSEELQIKAAQLRVVQRGRHAQLDLAWQGHGLSTETVMNWQTEPMKAGQAHSALSVRDVVQRHGGELWFERERVRQESFFRFLLPLASAQEPLEQEQLLRSDSRPEFYDFDLFAQGPQAGAWDERRLADLSYTVFDTETTGLNPGEGDEIIQIGAVRIVNGKLLKTEAFEQLVDPRRSIPEAGIPIHGITPEMVQGKADITQVLPAFHAFAADTVLVAHNAAFDMRFLQLKEQATGCHFEQPVLDTLLLSAVAHPHQESHRLEAIAERFGITILGRHTAMGDAMVTAEVFLRLLAQLQAQGITTLGQAREAAQKTYYARVQY